jgi:hypothetical protein
LLHKFETAHLIVAIILTLLQSLHALAGYQLKIDKFIIFGSEKDTSIIKYLGSTIAESNTNYEKFFSHTLARNVSIILPASNHDYHENTKRFVPDWSGAVTFVKKRTIILKPGEYFDSKEYRETMLHELAHIYIADKMVDQLIPVWLNEGIAMYLSGKTISWGESIILGNSILAGNIVALDKIDSLLSFGYLKAKVAYLEALLAVQYLIENYGEETVRNIITSLQHENSLDTVFIKNIGLDIVDFEYEWYAYLKKRYRWMVLLQFKNIMWFSLVLLVIVGFLIIKLRNRRIIKEWEQDDDTKIY